jgi:hypothetical protein
MILAILEISKNALSEASWEVLTAARDLAQKTNELCCGASRWARERKRWHQLSKELAPCSSLMIKD